MPLNLTMMSSLYYPLLSLANVDGNKNWRPHSPECYIQGLAFSQFSSVQSLSRVWLFAIPWITARQASLSITNPRISLRLTSIESVMPSSRLILCHLLLLPPIPLSIRVFSNQSTLHMRWPKYWSFSFSIIWCRVRLFIWLYQKITRANQCI